MPDYFPFLWAQVPAIEDPEQQKLAFLDRGCASSVWLAEIPSFGDRLAQMAPIHGYPDRGVVPPIDTEALHFLHPLITEACIVLIDADRSVRWFGRNPHDRGQFWSATKFLPMLYLIDQVETPEPPDHWLIAEAEAPERVYPFPLVLDLIVNYASPSLTSNALAALLKGFCAPAALEAWLQGITGNSTAIFRGGYGECPPMVHPLLLASTGQILRRFQAAPRGENLVSAYDLTRCLSQFAWAGGQVAERNLDRYRGWIAAMAKDTARYLDVSLELLGLQTSLTEGVILSKMGFGRSEPHHRNRSEITYTALLQSSAVTGCLTFRSALGMDHPGQEAMILDARMAAEITQTIAWMLAQP